MSGSSYLIITITFALIATCILIYFICVTKLKKYKDKMDTAEAIIEENLDKKLELIITLNGSIKKVTGKKDYLKDYVSIKDLIITKLEKDLKLEEAVKLISDLTNDYTELNSDPDFLKSIESLREIDEVLISAKNLFNQNAIESNKLIKNFPYNIVAKIAKYRIRSFYNSNTPEENENL